MLVQIVAKWAGEGGPGAAPGELERAAHVHKGPPAQLPVHLPTHTQPVTYTQVHLLRHNNLEIGQSET